VTSNETILELLKAHVLQDGEQVERVKNWPDGLALTTDLRHFVAGSDPQDWTISSEEWVDDVVVATRDDLLIEGQSERFGFVMLADGGHVYVNDATAMADLGRRLAGELEPAGYAQLLVAFHPYSSAYRAPLSESDDLRRILGQPDLPDVAPMRLRRSGDTTTLTFTSFARYRRPGERPLLDLFEWTVEVAGAGPASWSSGKTATGLELEPRQTGNRRPNWNAP
jgi:hypothetical protein